MNGPASGTHDVRKPVVKGIIVGAVISEHVLRAKEGAKGLDPTSRMLQEICEEHRIHCYLCAFDPALFDWVDRLLQYASSPRFRVITPGGMRRNGRNCYPRDGYFVSQSRRDEILRSIQNGLPLNVRQLSELNLDNGAVCIRVPKHRSINSAEIEEHLKGSAYVFPAKGESGSSIVDLFDFNGEEGQRLSLAPWNTFEDLLLMGVLENAGLLASEVAFLRPARTDGLHDEVYKFHNAIDDRIEKIIDELAYAERVITKGKPELLSRVHDGARLDRRKTIWVDPTADGIRKALHEQFVLAQKFALPNTVHFVRLWDEDGAYAKDVRKNYWHATQMARKNREHALNFLPTVFKDESCGPRTESLLEWIGNKGPDSLFDHLSGAVVMSTGDWEFSLHDGRNDSRLSQWRQALVGNGDEVEPQQREPYFQERALGRADDRRRKSLRRVMWTNSKLIFRGDSYYSNLKQESPLARLQMYCDEAESIEAVLSTAEIEPEAWRDLVSYGPVDHVGNAQHVRHQLDFKLTLALFDQIRQIGLVCISLANYQNAFARQAPDAQMLKPFIRNAVSLVEEYYSLLLGTSRVHSFREVKQRIVTALVGIRKHIERFILNANRNLAQYQSAKLVRGWREADHPFENLLVALGALKCASERGDASGAALGIFWGGVELPVVYNFLHGISPMGRSAPLRDFGIISYSRYSASAGTAMGFPEVHSYYVSLLDGAMKSISELRGHSVELFDDNSLTGTTLEVCRDKLLEHGAARVKCSIVRFSGERREGQIRMKRSGLLNPDALANSIGGYIGETPYSRSYSTVDYRSPTGIFNLSRSRILRYLHDNLVTSTYKSEGFQNG